MSRCFEGDLFEMSEETRVAARRDRSPEHDVCLASDRVVSECASRANLVIAGRAEIQSGFARFVCRQTVGGNMRSSFSAAAVVATVALIVASGSAQSRRTSSHDVSAVKLTA